MLALMLFRGQVQGQVFTAAVVPETLTGAATICTNTGNDYKQSLYGIGGVMSVNVWDGGSAGLGWDDFAGNAGFLTFTNLTYDPDVALVEDGANWWAVVAYFSPGTGYLCDFYKWTGTAFALSVSNTLSTCTVFLRSINIDGDVTGDFVVAWDDRCAGNIQVIGGSTLLAGAGPALCNGGIPIAATGTGGCFYPDVTLYSINGTTPQFGIYSLVFLNSNFQKIYVTFDKFTSLCAGVSNYNLAFTTFTTNNYYTPRIACPPAAQGTLKDWSVVVTDVSGTGYDVLGFTDNAGTVFSYNYTNASIFTPPAISQWNKYPAISYDNNYTGIIVSWKSFYTGSPLFTAPAPIAIQCDLFGSYPNFATGCFSEYMIVPSNNAVSTNTQDAISVAGRDAPRMFYTFCDNNFPDIVYKQVGFSSCSLRLSGTNSGTGIKVFPNPVSNSFTLSTSVEKNDEQVQLQITDPAGKQVAEYSGTIMEINDHSSVITSKLTSGLYILHVVSATQSTTLQMIKM